MEDMVNSTNTENHKCMDCGRILKSQRSKKNHQRYCKKRSTHSPNEVIIDNNTEIAPSEVFELEIEDAYEKITVCKKNIFKLPKGHIWKEFINEMTKQINLWKTKITNYRRVSVLNVFSKFYERVMKE